MVCTCATLLQAGAQCTVRGPGCCLVVGCCCVTVRIPVEQQVMGLAWVLGSGGALCRVRPSQGPGTAGQWSCCCGVCPAVPQGHWRQGDWLVQACVRAHHTGGEALLCRQAMHGAGGGVGVQAAAQQPMQHTTGIVLPGCFAYRATPGAKLCAAVWHGMRDAQLPSWCQGVQHLPCFALCAVLLAAWHDSLQFATAQRKLPAWFCDLQLGAADASLFARLCWIPSFCPARSPACPGECDFWCEAVVAVQLCWDRCGRCAHQVCQHWMGMLVWYCTWPLVTAVRGGAPAGATPGASPAGCRTASKAAGSVGTGCSPLFGAVASFSSVPQCGQPWCCTGAALPACPVVDIAGGLCSAPHLHAGAVCATFWACCEHLRTAAASP